MVSVSLIWLVVVAVAIIREMSFAVTSYNVLADAYINPGWYPGTPAAVLDRHRRLPALVRRIADLGAEVICLQEVEPDVFTALEEHLQPRGYGGRFARKGHGKPDGCATFVKLAAFVQSEMRVLNYADGAEDRPDSGHVAEMNVLVHGGRLLGVANTHLKWDRPGTPEADQWGLRQIVQLLRQCDEATSGCPSWIICGDFNVLADSAVVRALQRTGLIDAYQDRADLYTCNSNRLVKRIDYLFHTADLIARPVALPAIDNQTALPSEQEPSDHLPIMAWLDWADGGKIENTAIQRG